MPSSDGHPQTGFSLKQALSNPSIKQPIPIFFMLFACLLSGRAVGEDSLQTVMARMRPNSAVAINYQETRYLSLMSDRWTGSGYFYALSPDIMIKEQQHPEQELMAIKGSELYYFNQKSGQKHRAEMAEQDSLVAHTAAFKGLMNGDLASLKILYDIEFMAKPTGWIITLTTKKNAENDEGYQVIMQGLPEQVANKLELIMADGDRTEYLLSPASSGETVKLKMQTLFDLLEAH